MVICKSQSCSKVDSEPLKEANNFSAFNLHSFQRAASFASTNKLPFSSDILPLGFLEFEMFLKDCFDFLQEISAIKNLI